jgi:WD40 repeat protein
MSAALAPLHHFQVVAHNKDGWFLLGSSALTGKIWDGRLSVFSDYDDYLQCPNLEMISCDTQSGVNDALWLSGEGCLVAGTDSGCLKVYRLKQKTVDDAETKVQAHNDVIVGVALLAGGNETIVSVGLDSKVVVTSIRQERVLHTYRGHSDAVLAVVSHPTSESIFITSSRDGCIRLWDTRKPRPASNLESHVGMCTSLAWSSSNKDRIATGCQNGRVCITDWRKWSGNGSCLQMYQLHKRDVTKLAFAPWNCNVVASASEDTSVNVFSVTTESTLYSSSQHTDYVYGISWHPSKPCLLSCGWDSQLLLHHVTTDKPSAETPLAMETSENCAVPKDREQ